MRVSALSACLLVGILLPQLAVSLENGMARTPPMGWMSWAKFFCEIDCARHPYTCISEQLYMDMADRMVADGYHEVGYHNVHIDDCWMAKHRDDKGKLIANATRFEHGIPWLADYMHERGLKLGIYEDYGNYTCGGYPGSFWHLQQDASTFALWNVDYLKLDGCYANPAEMEIGYPQMTKFLNDTGRHIMYSCSWPAYLTGGAHPIKPNYTEIGIYCNLWRNYGDITAEWDSIQSIINYYDAHQDELIPTHGPGHWHDPDMIVVGNPTLTVDQSMAQFAIWSIWSAPLIMSNDLRMIAPPFKKILQNRKVIAIDQDPLGNMGRLVANTTNIGVYVKKVTPYDAKTQEHSMAVVIFNRNKENTASVNVIFERIGLTNKEGYFVEDLFTDKQYGLMRGDDVFQATVNPTGVVMLKATLAQALAKK